MSLLLDGGTELVELFAEVATTDDDGNPVKRPATSPTERLMTRLHPLSSQESSDRGIVATAYTFTTRDFPAGAWAAVRARGVLWDIVGEPQRSAGSALTRHTRVTIAARRSETSTKVGA